MPALTVRTVENQEDEARWDRYVAEQAKASAYHATTWRHVISRAFGHPSYYYMAMGESGEVRGILPLVHLKSPLFGNFLISLPYLNYGGVLADDGEATETLLQAASQKAKALGASHIELRHEAGSSLDWPKKDHKVSMRLELPQRFDDLMKAFPPKLRSQVRRGEKEGMLWQVGGIELLEDFYRVFALNMRDLGTPVYGKAWFAEILSAFPKEARLCIVSLQGQPLAAGFVLGFRNRLEIPWAASDRDYSKLAPNMMLYGAVLRYACEQGYQCFDFGRSSKDSGTYRFKEQWGAKPVPLEWHYWLEDGGPLPELNPQNPKYALAISIWQRLPVSITRVLGPHLAKHLP